MKSTEARPMNGSNQHSSIDFCDDLRVLTDYQLNGALNQCYTGEK